MSPATVPNIDFTKFYNIINGKKKSSDDSHYGVNPSTGEQLWAVPIGSQADVDEAVDAAKVAFKSWSRTTIEHRREKVKQFIELWGNYNAEFTELLHKENGKPRKSAGEEVGGVALWLSSPLVHDVPTETAEDDEKIVRTTYTPLGVCAGIIPWNFPLILSSGKIAPSVLAGNVIIIKPSPYTPYTALKMVELMQEVFPPGVVQVIGGDDKLGPMLTAHPGIAKVSFTGSIATGKKIMQSCAGTLKRVTLELGGNDATIVLPDVDIPKVAEQVAIGSFVNTGQVCVATKRVYIHESIYKPFVKAMAEFTKTLKLSNAEETAFLGPIQNQMQYDKVKDYYSDCKNNGYTFAAGSADINTKGKGYYVNPAIIDNPPNGSRIVEEEPFGPIVPCQPWSDEEEVIERANNSTTGLGACVWGKDIAKAEDIANRLEAGNVFVNSFEKIHPAFFFSGHKESGVGGEWGKQGFLAYHNVRVVYSYK